MGPVFLNKGRIQGFQCFCQNHVVLGIDVYDFFSLVTNWIFTTKRNALPMKNIYFLLFFFATPFLIFPMEGADLNGKPKSSPAAIEKSSTLAPLEVVSLFPQDGAMDVALDQNFIIEFNQPVQLGSGAVFLVDDTNGILGGVGVDARFISISGNIATIDFAYDINPNTAYHIEVAPENFLDLDGNEFSGFVDSTTWNFSAVGSLDTIAPSLVTLNPENGSTGVPLNTEIEWVFDEAMQIASFGAITIFEEPGNGNPSFSVQSIFPEDIVVDGTTITFNPPIPFDANTTYRFRFDRGFIEDLEGNDFFPADPDFQYIITTGSGDNTPFITTWKTDNPGISNDNQITIPTFPGESYDYTVDWGDGSSETITTSDALTHTYAVPGTYTVSITGSFPRIYFNNGFSTNPQDNNKLLTIEQWGGIRWESMDNAFSGCANLQVLATDTPDLSRVFNLREMFFFCSNLVGNSSFNDWDVSNVQSMIAMFRNTPFNAPIGAWDVSNVNSFGDMFRDAPDFNQPIGGWNLANANSIALMFDNASSFNQPIGNWNTSNVQFIAGMFSNATAFNQDISNWDVSNVRFIGSMFSDATAFNQDIGAWDLSGVEDMQGMFLRATSFNQDISGWNVGNVQNFSQVFFGATSFNQDIGGWDVSSATQMFSMFEGASNFDHDLSNWDVSNVAVMDGIFIDSGLSNENYDLLLQGWNELPSLQSFVRLDAPQNQFCTGELARQNIIDTYNWVINDGGKAIDCPDPQRPFVTTWKTDNPGASEDNQITIPTFPGETYNYTVDWGDGTSESFATSDAPTHTYTNSGVFTVSITGDFPRIFFEDNDLESPEIGDENKLLTVEQWGDIQWSSMAEAFADCVNLDVVAEDAPDLSNANSTHLMFIDCSALAGTAAFATWDVSQITDMGGMFINASLFNQNIGTWDVSQVTEMGGMFVLASSFNQDIGGWNVSQVTNMNSLFSNASSFNQDIGDWDVSQVSMMNSVFGNATAFNQDIGGWDVSRVTRMDFMFINATSFDQDLADWDISSLVNAESMFEGVTLSTENYDNLLSGWNTLDSEEAQVPSNIIFSGGNSQFCFGEEARQDLIDTFGWTITDRGRSPECFDLSTAFITTWKTDNPGGVDDRTITIPVSLQESYDFNVDWGDGSSNQNVQNSISHTYEEPGVYQVVISGEFPKIEFADQLQLTEVNQWGNTQWTSMIAAFIRCENLNIVATDVPDLSLVTITSSMFYSCTSLEGNSAINDWDVSNVTNMSAMFQGATLFNQNLSSWDTSNVDNMSGMFGNASSFNQDISSWDVSSVRILIAMFEQATSFNQDIGNWDVSNVTAMRRMFANASSFDQDLGDWDISALQTDASLDLLDMFLGVGLSTENYDATLIGWANLDAGETRIPQNARFEGGNSLFCFSEEARQNLIDNFGWTIADGGLDPSCPLNTELSVIGFNLIDADNDVVLRMIRHGDQISINDLPTTNLNIQAITTDDVESVRLELTGAQNNGRTENVAPYALFGDSNGDYASNVFPLGDYGLIGTPYSGNSLRGTVGTALEVSFSFVEEDPLCEGKSAQVISITDITQCDTFGGMVLIGLENFEANFSTIFGVVDRLSPNPETNVDYDGPSSLNNEPLEVFDITNLPGPGEYRAEIFDVDGCSVEVFFTLNGPDLPVVTLAPFDAVLDTDEAFVLTGGSPFGGTYSGEGVLDGMFDPSIGAGDYEITYSFTDTVTNCTNEASQTLRVLSSNPNNAILSFVLVDADTNEDIGQIMEGTVFDIASLPSNLNIRAETTNDVESVFMEISGGIVATRRENVAPYALFGDRNGDYFGSSFPTGSFTISATPYTGNNLRGEMGSTLSVAFSINGSQAAQNPIDLSIYPNPTTSSVMASFEEAVTVEHIQVFDVQGRLIRTYDAKRVKDGEGYRLDVNDMPAGSYFIRTQDTKGFNYQKQLVIER